MMHARAVPDAGLVDRQELCMCHAPIWKQAACVWNRRCSHSGTKSDDSWGNPEETMLWGVTIQKLVVNTNVENQQAPRDMQCQFCVEWNPFISKSLLRENGWFQQRCCVAA